MLTSPDVPEVKKREIIGTLIDKIICQMDGAKVVFLPCVIEAEYGISADTVQSISMICTVSHLKNKNSKGGNDSEGE